MRQGPFCCEKAENKNKRTHTVVSTAIAVTITHASPPRLSQQQEKKLLRHKLAQECNSIQESCMFLFYQASHWTFCTARVTIQAVCWTASFAFPLEIWKCRLSASERPGSGMRVEKHGQQWAPVSSTWQSHSMDEVLWDTLPEGLGWFGGAPISPALEAAWSPALSILIHNTDPW